MKKYLHENQGANYSLCEAILAVAFKSIITFPESAINRIPSIVMEVSAIFVATIHFLTPSGAMSKI